MRSPWRRAVEDRAPRDIWSDWKSANEAGDAVRAGELAAEMLSAAPDRFIAWFEAGLYSKSRRNWQESAKRNLRAMELFGPTVMHPFALTRADLAWLGTRASSVTLSKLGSGSTGTSSCST